jgi:hypothetical protein
VRFAAYCVVWLAFLVIEALFAATVSTSPHPILGTLLYFAASSPLATAAYFLLNDLSPAGP